MGETPMPREALRLNSMSTSDTQINPATPAAAPAAADEAAPAPSTARKLSRRRFLRRALALGAVPLALGAYATQVEPFWVDAHDLDVSIPGLPAAFDGFRIAHL